MVDRDDFDENSLPVARNNVSKHRVRGRNNGHVNGNVVEALRVLGDLTQRSTLASLAGLTFNAQRDMYNALGYKRVLLPIDFIERYRRGGITARIVEAFPDATWGNGAEIVEDEDPEVSTALEEDFVALNDRLQVWSILHRADVLAGLGWFSAILIGARAGGATDAEPGLEPVFDDEPAPGVKTQENDAPPKDEETGTLPFGKKKKPKAAALANPNPNDLSTELPKMSSIDDVLYLTPFGPDEVTITRFEEDPESERYGLPAEYKIQRKTPNVQSTQNFSRTVHWSRIIHVADGCLNDTVNGTPRLERVWNHLDDLDKVVGGGSEAFWLRAHQGYHWNVDKDLKVDDAALQKLKTEAEEFEMGMRRTMATRGIELTSLGSDVANIENPIKAIVSLISGATKIPQRILLGSERGELASSQDRENWNDRVESRRLMFGTPLVKVFVGRLIDYGALTPPAEEDDYDVRWPEIKGLTLEEQSKVAETLAGLNTTAGAPIIMPEEIRDKVLGMDKLSEEQLAEFEANKPKPPQIDPNTGKPVPPGMALDKDGKLVKQDELAPEDAMDPTKSNDPQAPALGPDGKPLKPGETPADANVPPDEEDVVDDEAPGKKKKFP